jgi:hypothetical protein
MKLRQLLGDPAWMFDFGVAVHEYSVAASNETLQKLDWELGDEYRMPPLDILSDAQRFAEVGVAWCDEGILLHAVVRTNGEKRTLGMPGPKMSFFLDTRHGPGVHRGTMYCHRFDFFLENPTSTKLLRGHGELIELLRARGTPKPIHPKDIVVGILKRQFGYEIKAMLKGSVLTGYQPREYQEIGLFYVVKDESLGAQTMARLPNTPYFEDPSLWCRGQLITPPKSNS